MTMVVCKNFNLQFMSILIVPVVKNSHFFDWNLLYRSKRTSWTKHESLAIPNFAPQWKDRKGSYHVRLV